MKPFGITTLNAVGHIHHIYISTRLWMGSRVESSSLLAAQRQVEARVRKVIVKTNKLLVCGQLVGLESRHALGA